MSAIPALPPGVTFIPLIKPALYLLIAGTVWAAVLVPLFCVLLFFSTPQIRRQPIFLMNLFAIVMGLVVGAVNLQIWVSDILSPPGESFKPRTLLAYLGMILFLPLFIDCILAFRLYVVYPPRTTSKVQLAIIFIPIAVLKIARTTNLIIFMVKFAAAISTSAVADFLILWCGAGFPDPGGFPYKCSGGFPDPLHAPWTKIEWILQVFDNCYASGFFLWKVWIGHRKAKASGIVHSRSTGSSADKLKSLFYLALSCFVFPCMFSIAQVILTFRNHDFFLGAYVFVNNIYIEIVGVLLATIWATKGRSENTADSVKAGSQVSTIRYRLGGNGSQGINLTTERTHNGNVELEEFDSAIPQDKEFTRLPKAPALGHEVV
ncbi:hypothetical protein MVEN_02396700 [Mycena venus]|uniref:Uncharacterized protein n=1 Tax=Mycena venus TaxID=2733690 RepID=A0A8H6X1Y4_9AGAR|nr:hypothetical protein MVEN_02396700 [Mycena venus]